MSTYHHIATLIPNPLGHFSVAVCEKHLPSRNRRNRIDAFFFYHLSRHIKASPLEAGRHWTVH
jgi:hypothetical protein